jgi:hypothetical protein
MMKCGEDGLPVVAQTASGLGVRIKLDEGTGDIPVDGAGEVSPGTGGMSVRPSINSIPPQMLPKRLKEAFPDLFPEARGNSTYCVWSMGEGLFETSSLTDNLDLRLDPDEDDHGFVEPSSQMSFDDYFGAVVATRQQWYVDEDIS